MVAKFITEYNQAFDSIKLIQDNNEAIASIYKLIDGEITSNCEGNIGLINYSVIQQALIQLRDHGAGIQVKLNGKKADLVQAYCNFYQSYQTPEQTIEVAKMPEQTIQITEVATNKNVNNEDDSDNIPFTVYTSQGVEIKNQNSQGDITIPSTLVTNESQKFVNNINNLVNKKETTINVVAANIITNIFKSWF